MEGFYAIYYTGTAGFGHAVLIFKDETITGADATGGIYDGSYSIGDGTIDFQVDLCDAVALACPGGAQTAQ